MLKVTIKTPERRHWGRSGVFNINFGHVSQQFLKFLLLNLNKQMLARTLTCLISNESKVKIVFNKRICQSLFQVVNFYLTSTVRSVTQIKKYFFISHFFPHLIRVEKKQEIEPYHFRRLSPFKQMSVHRHVK